MAVQGIILDIEGTLCPISFVKDVLFPYALRVLPATVSAEWDDAAFRPYRDAFPAPHRSSPVALSAHARELTAHDSKAPYLKSLQGYLWQRGYAAGELRCPLFPDVAPALRAWQRAAVPVVIYSSGSVAAQKLLFEHTDAAPEERDLRPLVADYFDTLNAGPKTERASYENIAARHGGRVEAAEKWLFVSDNVREVQAALAAGMQAAVMVRSGNPALTEEERERYRILENLSELAGLGI